MKYIYIFILICSCNLAHSQVLIGITTPTNASVALEFGTEPRGILLEPATLPASPDADTIVFDDASGSIRYYNGTSWSAPVIGGLTNTVTDYTSQGQVIINDTSTATDGIFVIEDSNTAPVSYTHLTLPTTPYV